MQRRTAKVFFGPFAWHASGNSTGNKSLFACFSEDKRKALFFSEEKNQKTFIFGRLSEDPGFGRRIEF
jgi:hypothetical protein